MKTCKAKITKAKTADLISEFGFVPDEKNIILLSNPPQNTPHCHRSYLGTSPVIQLETSIDMM